MKKGHCMLTWSTLLLIQAATLCADTTLRLTCMAPVGGVLNTPQVYALHPDGTLTLNDRPISTFKLAELSRTTDDHGIRISQARHRWLVPNERLERRVIWIDSKGRKRTGMLEVLDFKAQKILDKGKDVCHHAQYRPAPLTDQ